MEGLVFGWRTAILAVVVVQLLIIAFALTRALRNHVANRTLAALLIVLAGVVTPWMIGFAGFYDRWRWLTFAPFSIPLAVAPLLWLYIATLIDGRWPARGWRHLLPAAVQFAFLAIGFLLPMPLKDRWSDASAAISSAVFGLATIVSIAAYGLAGLRLLRRYRHRLADERSDDVRYAALWLSRATGAMLVLLPVWSVYAVWDAVSPLGYLNLMGLYLAIAAFALYLAIEGWRHAALAFPHFAEAPVTPIAARDWQAQGAAWAEAVRAGGWAADPELSLASLARLLGTNSGYLSRALNEGLGIGFSAFVNGLRSEAVAERLRGGGAEDLIDLALEAGFASKASFNRAFRATFGMSPSAYRRHGSIPE
ncbi:helix-turn-helix domain-containing protein [Sphingomonas sp. GB1N7]|uniref:helix-turn-helix domain-containing protein n=1 Tax=Parasphingomonas caseinilytica TaxID=3096158 RepID=UPI002FC87810